MKKTTFLFYFIILSFFANSQTIKLQVGTSISRLDWQTSGFSTSPLYDEIMIGPSLLIGVDYLERKYFNISSNIGFIKKGGKEEFETRDQSGITGETVIQSVWLDYITLNTTFDLKLPVNNRFTPFISIGPRIGYIINNSNDFEPLIENNELSTLKAGLIAGGGLMFLISNFQLGIRADYYSDFGNVAEWNREVMQQKVNGKIRVESFTVNLTFGYKL